MLTKRMAMRRMNEICRWMTLNLVFCVLLLHTCQAQSDAEITTGVTKVSTVTQAAPKNTISTSITSSIELTTDNQVTSQTNSTNQSMLNFTSDQANDTSTPTVANPSDRLISGSYVYKVDENQNMVETSADKSAYTTSENSSVFVPILVSGLILAAALIGLYVWKNHCNTKVKGMKLANDSCMADEENQGNTLVSVAPLNPPESQEKPSLNGESVEPVKPQNPPAANNGHSTAKADTEL